MASAPRSATSSHWSLSSGQFAAINGVVIGNGNQFDPVYSATNLTFNVIAAPPAPAPLVLDSDGDGFSDSQEAIAGTNPLDSRSVPADR